MSYFDLKPYIVDLIYENISGVSRQGNQLNFRCPICGDGKKRKSKRGHFYLDTNSYYCFNGGCDANEHGMSGLVFLSRIMAMPVQDVKRELIKRAGSMKKAMEESKVQPIVETPKKQVYIPPIEGLVKEHVLDGDWTDELPSFVEEIIEKRKLKKAPFLPKDFHFYFDKKEERLVIPWNENYYQERAITYEQEKESKYKFPSDIEKPIFGLTEIDKSIPYIFLVEGVFDSIWVKNGVAVGSLTISNHQRKLLKENASNLELVYLMDNQWKDKTSLEKTKKILKEEPFTKVFIWPKELSRFKDINESIIYSDKMIKLWSNIDFLKSRISHGIKGMLMLNGVK